MNKNGYKSRLAFIQGQGIDTKDSYAWSYVDASKRKVIFGEWEHHDTETGKMIFSEAWSHRNGRRQSGYTKSRPHIDLIIEENYDLYTFPQIAKPGTEGGRAIIDDWSADLTKKELKQVGARYFAVPLGTLEKELGFDPKDESTEHIEGHAHEVTSTRYERNSLARAKCIEHFGARCGVCLFDFEKTYGEIGVGYIHVHHLIRVADRPKPYKINPIEDLMPVCPNCHAMIHKRIPPFSINEMKAMLPS